MVGVVDDGGHDLAVSGAVAFQLVGDQPPGRAALPFQQLAEESFGSFLITATRDEDIEHITILLYRAPEVLVFALYLYQDLIHVPRVTETTLSTPQSPSVFRPELDARCFRYQVLVMCTHPFAKEALTLHLAWSEGRKRYFGCNLLHRKVLASSHQHLMAEAPVLHLRLDGY